MDILDNERKREEEIIDFDLKTAPKNKNVTKKIADTTVKVKGSKPKNKASKSADKVEKPKEN